MRILIGTEKQVAWAIDIRRVAIELLEDKKETRGDLKDYIDIAIDNIEDIEYADYIIENLKELTTRKSKEAKFKILVNWMKYTEHDDFKGLIFGLSHKQMELKDEYKDLSKNIKPPRKKSWIDDYLIPRIICEDF